MPWCAARLNLRSARRYYCGVCCFALARASVARPRYRNILRAARDDTASLKPMARHAQAEVQRR